MQNVVGKIAKNRKKSKTKFMVKNLIYIVFSLFFILKVDIAFSQNKIEKLNEKTKKLVEKTLNKENIPGISISISINDSLIFSEGFGYSNIENKTKINPSKTKFRIASITKTLTATTIARLSELNQIDLDKSVYFYLDSLPKKDFDFTIKQVGGHLSGIQRVPSTEKYSCDNNYCEKDFYKIFKNDNLLFEPATNFEYSNYGYKLLGLIIEKVTNESIIENHKKHIIDIIGLKNTFAETILKDSLTTNFYTKEKNKNIEAPCLDCNFKFASGCYLSTSEDLIKLGNAYLYPNRILKRESLIELIKTQKLKNGKKTNYGFGFGTGKDFYDNYFYGHNGGYVGSRSTLRIYPKNNLVIVILMNCDYENIDNLATEIAKIYIAN